ncbi:MAG: YbaB/EbfC family nucleoid-associated protein [Rhodospirillales bacterium]
MKNLGKMMQQAQEIQAKMARMQDELAEMEVSGSSGAGMVQVTLNGKGEARGVKIDPSLLSGADTDVEVLEDLIVAAINDAKSKAEQEMQSRMQDLTGGLGLPPGFKLPF